MTGNIVGLAARLDEAAYIGGSRQIVAGDIAKVRIDLEEATEHLLHSWAHDDHDRLHTTALAAEAIVRAISTLTNLVERVEAQNRQDIGVLRGRICKAEFGS